MASKNLKQKAVSGVIWTSIQRFLSIFIQFISGIILARLLSPEDYGCIGMLTVFTMIATIVIDGGFGSALIQKKAPTDVDYSTIFHWNVCLSILIYVVLYVAAPTIADFYHIELLCPVLRVQGLIVIIGALQTIHVNMLNKQFKFKKISIVTLITSVVSLAITIIMAYKGYGVWSLVAQNILVNAIPCVIYWCTNHWFPKFVFSTKSFKELFSFGVYMFLTSLMTQVVNNIQSLLIGRIYSASTLGYFSKAKSTERLASTSISQVMGQVTYPLYAEMQDEKERLANTIKRITLLLSYTTFPLMVLLILIAEPLFVLLYSDKWLPAVPYFQVLCLAGMALCLHSVNGQAIAAVGKSKAMFIWSVVKQSAGLVAILAGLYFWGMKGLLVGAVFRSWFVYVVNASLVTYFIGYNIWRQVLDLMPVVLLTIATFAISYLIGHFVGTTLYITAIIEVFSFISIYVTLSVVFKVEAYKLFVDMISPLLSKYLHKK